MITGRSAAGLKGDDVRDLGETPPEHAPPGRLARDAATGTSNHFNATRMPLLSDRLIADVVRRVAVAQGAGLPRSRDAGASDAEIDALCDALVSDDAEAAARLIREAEARGTTADSLYLDYITVAARRMGDRWLEDCASFLDVSLAGGRLAALVRELSLQFGGAEVEPLPGHSILITTIPEETHSLGASIAAEYFRRSRWHVTLLDGADMVEIDAALARIRPAVVGLSAGSRRMVPGLTDTVRTVRARSPEALVVIGGPILELEPEIVRTVGADQASEDPAILSVMLRRHITVRTLGTGSGHVHQD